jgi:hypothetical protein
VCAMEATPDGDWVACVVAPSGLMLTRFGTSTSVWLTPAITDGRAIASVQLRRVKGSQDTSHAVVFAHMLDQGVRVWTVRMNTHPNSISALEQNVADVMPVVDCTTVQSIIRHEDDDCVLTVLSRPKATGNMPVADHVWVDA